MVKETQLEIESSGNETKRRRSILTPSYQVKDEEGSDAEAPKEYDYEYFVCHALVESKEIFNEAKGVCLLQFVELPQNPKAVEARKSS
jgi:hypothetical protein